MVVLEPQSGGLVRAMECLGLCPLAAGWLPRLGSSTRARGAPLVGGAAQGAGLSTPSGVPTGQHCGAAMIFVPFDVTPGDRSPKLDILQARQNAIHASARA